MSDNIYCYPESEALINKLNITDRDELFEVEKQLTFVRLQELQQNPIDGAVHGWFLKQDGEALSGNLNSEIDDTDTDYIVTISEEGEDGLLMEVEGGETYHFTKEETPDYIALLKINTEGMGTVAYGPEGSEVEFEEDFPTQSVTENIEKPTTYIIKAKPDEGWKFVKWTKDGEDFSTESEITVEVSEDVEYRAVFETE